MMALLVVAIFAAVRLSTGQGVVEITGSPQFSLQTIPTADPPVFTLTCVSTGGIATTVTWTRDGAAAIGVTSQTVVDQEAITYNNTLTVTGRLPGNYQCSVANDRTAPPATASLTVADTAAPSNVSFTHNGTTITVTWTPTSPAPSNGYMVYYTDYYSYLHSARDEGSVSVSSGSDSQVVIPVTNIVYTVSVVAVSDLPSVQTEAVPEPYVEIFDQVLLPNNSLVENTVIRLRCITGRVDCCNTNANTKWYLPTGIATTNGISSYGSNTSLGAIELVTGGATSLNQGIHRCTLPESDPATNPSTISLYVGIYNPGQGGLEITGPLQFSLQTTRSADLPVFTLTCVSTGGPATTVTWTRDGVIVSNDANHVFTKTVTDQLTATYSNVLTVTGREPGNYTCSVANTRTALPATASLTVAVTPPTITDQPDPQLLVVPGQSATFTVVATGDNLMYQWQKGGSDIAIGATSATYTIAAVAESDTGKYQCVVFNIASITISIVASLTVLDPPMITNQSDSQILVVLGQPATFTVTATGDNLMYQWQKDGSDIDGANSATYAIAAIAERDEGMYQCVVSNAANSVTSIAASLTVLDRPIITDQPVSLILVVPGQSATFTVTATGDNLMYQWQKGGSDIAIGATSATYTIAAVAESDMGMYQCVVFNIASVTISTAANLTVLDPPMITDQSDSLTLVVPGQAATFTVTATGDKLMYQWQKDGSDIDGANSATYVIVAIAERDEGVYQCVVSNAANFVTSTATSLTVLDPPVITDQPDPQLLIVPGQPATFTVTATSDNLMYQWQKDGSNIATVAISATYTIAAVAESDEGAYRCVVTNAADSVTSTAASLTVLDPPVITEQPVSLALVIPGQSATFTVTATGDNLMYQWQNDGVDIAIGASSATFNIAAVAKANEGKYRCIVSNSIRYVTSTAASLTVLDPPMIPGQPVSLTFAVPGQSATFTINAVGDSLMYQWQKDGSDITGANSDTYTIAAITESDMGMYQCVVSNDAETIISTAVSLTVLDPPMITDQPDPQLLVVPGQPATFTVTATSNNLMYQWQKDGMNITTGANSATYTIAEVAESDEGEYRCIVSNAANTTISTAASLTVLDPAMISNQPDSLVLVVPGQPATFTVTTTGDNLMYQWQVNGSNIATGATSATYIIAAVTESDEGMYWCVVSNSANSVTSTAASLTVLDPPMITDQPDPQLLVKPGQSANFTVIATGDRLMYQWQKDGSNIAGDNSATYTIAVMAESDEGEYRCVMRNDANCVTSTAASLTVLDPPVITGQPVSLMLAVPGQSSTFTVVAMGDILMYQWQKNGSNITAGATSDTYTIAAVAARDTGMYRCVVFNADNSTISTAASLTVLDPPMITDQPDSLLLVVPGQTATFTVTAMGDNLMYQWQKNGSNIDGAISTTYNAISATYTIDIVAESDEGMYRCVVSNAANSVTSTATSLTVLDPPMIIDPPDPHLLVVPGWSPTFSVTAMGDKLKYQWQKDGSNVTGANSATYVIAAVAESDEGMYRCVVTNAADSVTSTAANLTVLDPPMITDQSDSLILVVPGQSATFNVTAMGNNLTYQWQKDGSDITTGANSSSYTIAAVAEMDTGIYRCVVINAAKAIPSNAASLTVLDPPVITVQPVSLALVITGQYATFIVVATGDNLEYQWQKNESDIATEANLTSYTIAAVAEDDEGMYRCVVTNAADSVPSDAASLTVFTIPSNLTILISGVTVATIILVLAAVVIIWLILRHRQSMVSLKKGNRDKQLESNNPEQNAFRARGGIPQPVEEEKDNNYEAIPLRPLPHIQTVQDCGPTSSPQMRPLPRIQTVQDSGPTSSPQMRPLPRIQTVQDCGPTSSPQMSALEDYRAANVSGQARSTAPSHSPPAELEKDENFYEPTGAPSSTATPIATTPTTVTPDDKEYEDMECGIVAAVPQDT